MIRSNLWEIIEEFKKDGCANSNNVDISIPKEDFPKYIKSFKVNNLNLPTEEEAKKVYDEIGGTIEFINFELAIETLCDWEDPSIYSLLENNEFFYVGDFDSMSCNNLGINPFYVKVLESTYYLYYYKKSSYSLCPFYDTEILSQEFLNKLKETLLRFKDFLARISLYKEAFIKLDMKEDLKLCESNYDKATRIYSLGIFMHTLINTIISGE